MSLTKLAGALLSFIDSQSILDAWGFFFVTHLRGSKALTSKEKSDFV